MHCNPLSAGAGEAHWLTEVYKQHGNKAKKASEKQSFQGNPFRPVQGLTLNSKLLLLPPPTGKGGGNSNLIPIILLKPYFSFIAVAFFAHRKLPLDAKAVFMRCWA